MNRAFSADALASQILGLRARLAMNAAPLALNKYRRGYRGLRSVLGEKLVLATSVLTGHRNLASSQAHLAQPGGSMFALLFRDGSYAQGCKGYCDSGCHFRFDRYLHTANRSLLVDLEGMCFGETFRRSSLQPPPKLNEAMLSTRNGS